MKSQAMWLAAAGAGALVVGFVAGSQHGSRSVSHPAYIDADDARLMGNNMVTAPAGAPAMQPAPVQAAPAQAAPVQAAAPAGGAPDEQIVRRIIEQKLYQNYHIIAWTSVQIGPAMEMGSASLQLPEHSIVYPAVVAYTGATSGDRPLKRDYRERWLIYRDLTTGQWTGQLQDGSGTGESYY
jgi:hypothetical protein